MKQLFVSQVQAEAAKRAEKQKEFLAWFTFLLDSIRTCQEKVEMKFEGEETFVMAVRPYLRAEGYEAEVIQDGLKWAISVK